MRVLRVILLVALVAVSVFSVMPAAAQEPFVDATCDGDLLVTVAISGADVGDLYRVNGTSGPGLPTVAQVSSVDGTLVLSWTLPGPGTWEDLHAQIGVPDNGGTYWHYDFNWDLNATCVPKGTTVLPGCPIFVAIPPQAVSGHFNWNSEIYWAPGHQIFPMIYVEAGNTYYIAGQDATETYYKALISCQWVWVRKDTVGPNYDPVWQGKPLPTDIVE